jgi:uncharacterized protein YbjT (DUF2867 family)
MPYRASSLTCRRTGPYFGPRRLAAGSEGSTGNRVSRFLLERGLRVRAFVHRIDQRSDELSALGAEIVQGHLLDVASVRRATAGVRRAYFVYPVRAGLLEATTTFAVAAKDCHSLDGGHRVTSGLDRGRQAGHDPAAVQMDPCTRRTDPGHSPS